LSAETKCGKQNLLDHTAAGPEDELRGITTIDTTTDNKVAKCFQFFLQHARSSVKLSRVNNCDSDSGEGKLW